MCSLTRIGGEMNYDDLPAGREMDALIAEKVMGLTPQKDFGEWPEHEWKLNKDGAVDDFGMECENHNGPACSRCYYSYCKYCPSPNDHGKFEVSPRMYSTSISSAWEVVEKYSSYAANKVAEELGLSGFSLLAYPSNHWNCMIMGKSSSAPTAPLAICRA